MILSMIYTALIAEGWRCPWAGQVARFSLLKEIGPFKSNKDKGISLFQRRRADYKENICQGSSLLEGMGNLGDSCSVVPPTTC